MLTDSTLQENGVDVAIQCIYRNMEYANVLIQAKASKNGSISESEDIEDEEEWTFIGDGDHDLASDDEATSPSPSRRLPNKSVIWTDSAPAGHRSPPGRTASYKGHSVGSSCDSTSTKDKGQ